MTVCILLAERLVYRNENWHCLRARWCYIKTWTVDSIFQPIRWNQDQSEKKLSGVIAEKQALLNNLGSNLGENFKEDGNPEQRRIEMNCSMACVYSVLLKHTYAVAKAVVWIEKLSFLCVLLKNNRTFQIVSRILRTMDVLEGYAMLHGRCYWSNESIKEKEI